MSVIQLKDVVFYRGTRAIFNGVTLDIPEGKVTAILGPSGTGKTTLLKLMTGQEVPHSGQVNVLGQEVPQLSMESLLALRRQMGFLFQSGALLTDLSVFDNVAFPLREQTQLSEGLIQNLVMMKLQAVGLRNASQLMPSELSGGMARRVALARSMALEPSIIMYDEPFTGQDPISMGVLVKLIRELTDAMGVTSVVVSHDVAEVMSIADHVVILSAGEVVAQGSPDELETLGSPWVKQFIHGEPDGPVPFHMAGRDYSEDLVAQ